MLFTWIKNVWLFERLSYNYKPQSMNVINYKNTLKCIVYGTIMDRKLSINFARSCMNGMFSVTQALVWKKHQLNCLHNWPYFFFIHKKGLLCFINVNDFFFHISCGYLRMARDSYFKGRIRYTLESSLFMWDQCSWLFVDNPCPWMYMQTFV